MSVKYIPEKGRNLDPTVIKAMLRFKISYNYYNKENVFSVHITFVLFHVKLNGWKNILYHDAYLLFLVGLSDPTHFSRFVSIALAYKLRSRWGGFAIS